MAKKKSVKKQAGLPLRSDTSEKVKLTQRDKKTIGSLINLADTVVASAQKTKDPRLEIPTRSLSNVRYNKSQRILEMGKNTTARQLFNLNQAKSYMQTMLAAAGCKRLVESGKTTSIRGLYYLMKHTIAGTKEETFSDQAESDPIIEDLEVLLESLREELHLYAQQRGSMVGNIILNDKGDTIDCSRMGSGGYGIPSIVEADVIQFTECGADFVLHVEKDTVWQRFNEDKFWKKHNCILTHGSGQPPRGVRRLLHRLHNELKLPIYCVFDNDPWGYYIYSVIKQGSINLAYESKRMAVPEAKFLGLRAIDYERCDLNPSVQIALNDTDRKRAKQIAKYPWFEQKKTWQKEIQKLLDNGFKLEVEALISQGLSYVTDVYVPERLEDRTWLD
ncbi:DNA topoisomerase IV subunit A [Blastopirellula sp. J2-11]|uniref:DNA topoisomerase IV subunit A n=1 Tax=Blastopirellula sp. J2-11 TaxID=2943192 RepID=UPI0021C5D4E7|nr:DNA topoisomerase IV subunit A [Blastopirellula sp. J2-11]UUO06397.1 DNA topoisomerase IV subunit A [Blastopirellula sp. J2-11]